MNKITQYLSQLGVIYVGLLIPYNLYYAFLIYILKQPMDKGFGMFEMFLFSILVYVVALFPLFFVFNLFAFAKYIRHYKFNYWFIFINSLLAGVVTLFLDDFNSSLILNNLVVYYGLQLLEYLVVLFVLAGLFNLYKNRLRTKNKR